MKYAIKEKIRWHVITLLLRAEKYVELINESISEEGHAIRKQMLKQNITKITAKS